MNGTGAFRSFVARKPLQAGKLVGIVLTLILGFFGFFRILSANAIINDPTLADGQFLTLVLLPLVSLALICIIVLETLVTGYRALRADRPLRDQLTARVGYTIVRGTEATIAVVGLIAILSLLPILFADSTPAPVGVGLLLTLLVIGGSILVVSFVRALLELYNHVLKTP